MSILSSEQRAALVTLFDMSGVYAFKESELDEPFLAGVGNPSLEELNIDSLSAIELCVAIEKDYGTTIAPTELGAFETVEDLGKRIFDL